MVEISFQKLTLPRPSLPQRVVRSGGGYNFYSTILILSS